MKNIDSYKLASVIAKVLDDKKAKDITILNISNVSVLTDYFVICSAEATPQVRAISSAVREKIKELYNRYANGEEFDAKNRWNLLDYGDVVVHILHKEERETYAIEKFWNHACRVELEDCLKEAEDID